MEYCYQRTFGTVFIARRVTYVWVDTFAGPYKTLVDYSCQSCRSSKRYKVCSTCTVLVQYILDGFRTWLPTSLPCKPNDADKHKKYCTVQVTWLEYAASEAQYGVQNMEKDVEEDRWLPILTGSSTERQQRAQRILPAGTFDQVLLRRSIPTLPRLPR